MVRKSAVGVTVWQMALLILLLVTRAPALYAEEHPAEPEVSESTDEADSSESEGDSEEAEATATPSNEAPAQTVEPLDAWIIHTPTPTPSPTATPTPAEGEHAAVPNNQSPRSSVPAARSITEIYGPRAYRQGLSKTQQKRLKAILPVQRTVAREIRMRADPRGEAELKVCTVHLNNFGPAAEFKRLMKGEGPEKRLARQSSAVSAIAAAACDVVAVQAVYGVSFTRAHEALDGFAEKLAKATDSNWEVQLEEGTKQLVWSGFLLREGVGQVLRSESLSGLQPPPFGPTPIRDVARAFTTLSIKVKGKGVAGSKIVTLVNFDLRHALAGKSADSVYSRVQLAEVLRGVVDKYSLQDQVANPQLLVVLGDRNDVRGSAPAQILEGQLKFTDFTEDGTCKFEGEKELKLRCHDLKRQGKRLFGVVSENAWAMRKRPPAPKVPDAHAEGAPKTVKPPPFVETRTTEIYLTQRDLKYARLLSDSLSRYRVGTEPVRNGLPDSPLTWVMLNWP